MSNWPRNHADFSRPNWTARTPDRRPEVDWSTGEPDEPSCLALALYAVTALAAFFAGFWMLYFIFG